MTEAISLKDIYEKISEVEEMMVTKDELYEYLETFEIMSNAETMESVRRSREDIKKGRVKKISKIQDILNE